MSGRGEDALAWGANGALILRWFEEAEPEATENELHEASPQTWTDHLLSWWRNLWQRPEVLSLAEIEP